FPQPPTPGHEHPVLSCQERCRSSVAILVLKRNLHPGSIRLDLPVLELEVEFSHLGDSKVTQRPACLGHRRAGGLLPGFPARTYEFYDLVHALGHDKLLSSRCCLETKPPWTLL